MNAYSSLEALALDTFSAMRPKEILSVTEAASKYHIIRQPGAHSGPWSAEKTPYMVEVQDLFTSLDYTGVAFVGPARTGKSAAAINWIVHTAMSDPADMMVVHMTQNDARKWSKDDLTKMFRHSKEVRSLLRPGRTNDNTFDKEFTSGMRLSIVWPTANALSGVTIPRVMLLDYDRMPDDVDGEGNPFDLGRKRTTTFKRFGQTYVESSPNPNKEIEDPKWRPKTPHQAPPIRGIFEIYNRGDRRLWYWHCIHCREAFEPNFKYMHWPDSTDFFECGEAAQLKCPHCGGLIAPRYKDELNNAGRWVRDGMYLTADGEIVPLNGKEPGKSDIASFWLKGPAAGYQDWKNLVVDYLRAEQAYEDTGDEAPLKKTVTADQGSWYVPKSRQSERMPEDLKDKAENWGTSKEHPTVPFGVRFLIATVDVQARSFVVQINGFNSNGDLFVVDAYKLTKSARLDDDGDRLPMSPFSHGEDWDLLISEVMLRQYELADGSGRSMKILATFCDSGGGEGATHNAYNFWRRLKSGGEGLHRKFTLVKGNPTLNAPRAYTSWPDSKRNGPKATAKGDVPVVMLNANMLKDQVAAMMQRRVEDVSVDEDERSGMLRYPEWMEDWFYSQLCNEIRTAKGWENLAKRRNESFDLSYYAIGVAYRPREMAAPVMNIQLDRINWDNPPRWAEEWDENDLVTEPVQQLAEALNTVTKALSKEKHEDESVFAKLGRRAMEW